MYSQYIFSANETVFDPRSEYIKESESPPSKREGLTGFEVLIYHLQYKSNAFC